MSLAASSALVLAATLAILMTQWMDGPGLYRLDGTDAGVPRHFVPGSPPGAHVSSDPSAEVRGGALPNEGASDAISRRSEEKETLADAPPGPKRCQLLEPGAACRTPWLNAEVVHRDGGAHLKLEARGAGVLALCGGLVTSRRAIPLTRETRLGESGPRALWETNAGDLFTAALPSAEGDTALAWDAVWIGSAAPLEAQDLCAQDVSPEEAGASTPRQNLHLIW